MCRNRSAARESIYANGAGSARGSLVSVCIKDLPMTRTKSDDQLRFRFLQVDAFELTTALRFIKVAATLALAVVPATAVAQSASITTSQASGAPENVRVQPRGRIFAPDSAEVEAVQKRLSQFNAMQAAEDALFDRRLTVCPSLLTFRCGFQLPWRGSTR